MSRKHPYQLPLAMPLVVAAERVGMEHEDAKLHEFDKVEWFDVCKRMKPGLTWEEYEPIWDAFQADKDARLSRQEMS